MNNSATHPHLPIDTNATRFWWVRHAPVPQVRDIMYGSLDVDCDCSNIAVFEGVASRLPKQARWIVSPLVRTEQTANALIAAGANASELVQDARIQEMDFGDLNGQRIVDLHQQRNDGFIGHFPVSPFETTPNGESFSHLVERVSDFMQSMQAQHAGEDIVCVAHRGTIMAALHYALQLPLHTSVAFKIDNVSLTRMWHYNNAHPEGHDYKLGEVGWLP